MNVVEHKVTEENIILFYFVNTTAKTLFYSKNQGMGSSFLSLSIYNDEQMLWKKHHHDTCNYPAKRKKKKKSPNMSQFQELLLYFWSPFYN